MIQNQKNQTKRKIPLQPYKSLPLRRLQVRSVSTCHQESIVLIVTHEELAIINIEYQSIVLKIKKLSTIRSANLSKCGRFILCHYSSNNLKLFSSFTGKQIVEFIGIPASSRIFQLSDKCNKIIAGNNQMICLWNISSAKIQIMTKQWKNINCYALNKTGEYFALGTFNGQIYILRCLENNQCAQIQFKGHTKCIMQLAWHQQQLISIDYGNNLIIFECAKNQTGITYTKNYNIYCLSFAPISILSLPQRFFLKKSEGICWFRNDEIVGLEKDNWSVIQLQKSLYLFIRITSGNLQFLYVPI